ncbi:styrene monooxygenase/indole monooxygenase family protein [Amycolatopsis sp. GM8]|uniref:styrene monooxygenase/indole monooxygenase family protein n=1 Tax=Amycolatopsis sp. GM8 TaxID=2896530 RepID=UPI001F347EE5|nr:styrene monooxygenase/indole monooxygenase family protein [Amycolatopsis sp. GM8]
MRKIAVVGAGPAGCITAYGLVQAGYEVTLYSDRTPDEWLNKSRPTGSAYLYEDVIDVERSYGMDHWSSSSFRGQGFLLDSLATVGGPRMTVTGRTEFGRRGAGIDQRMRVSRWLSDFEGIGGKLVIGSVDLDWIDKIALANDLTILAAGKAELSKVIEVDPRWSPFSSPQRNLAMAVVKSRSGRHVSEWFGDRLDYVPTKFNQFGDVGEYFWVPYEHKTEGATFALLFEARPGSMIDRFGEAASGADVVAIGSQIVRETAPWETHIADDMVYVDDDPHAWLTGRFTPAVRKAFGVTPSGGRVIPVGDTAISFDPVCGQGGNFANRSAKFLVDVIAARGEQAYDDAWLAQVGQDLWLDHGRTAWEFNNLFLEKLPASATRVLETASTNPAAGDVLFNGFPHTDRVLPILMSEPLSREFADRYSLGATR